MEPNLIRAGTMYFASTRTDSGKVAPDGKIYRAPVVNCKYASADPLPGLLNRGRVVDCNLYHCGGVKAGEIKNGLFCLDFEIDRNQ